MQQTLPYRNWLSSAIITTTTTTTSGSLPTTSSSGCTTRSGESNDTMRSSRKENSFIATTKVAKCVSENAIIVVAIRGCCMCHVVKKLLLGLGVNPKIFEVNDEDEDDVKKELSIIVGGDGGGDGGTMKFPAVFVGGNLLGGLDKVMATHISGELVPILKEVGALWL